MKRRNTRKDVEQKDLGNEAAETIKMQKDDVEELKKKLLMKREVCIQKGIK